MEGFLEEPVADRLLEYCGHDKGIVFGRRGFGYILTKAHEFEPMTRSGCGVLVLTDFRDSGTACPPLALHKYLLKHRPKSSPDFLFRFAEAELESWLLADREAIASFLKIALKAVPAEPDKESVPKRTVINLARRSRRTDIKNALVPPENFGGMVGPDYVPTMTDFVRNHWRPDEAAKNSPSLNRCINRLLELGQKSLP